MSDDVKLYTFAGIAARPPQECHPETTYVDAREHYAAMAAKDADVRDAEKARELRAEIAAIEAGGKVEK